MRQEIMPLDELQSRVKEKGGWVNAHAHADRSYIVTAEEWGKTGDNLEAKWDYSDRFKRGASVDDIYRRLCRVAEGQIAQGSQALCSFIDADSVVEDKALQAAAMLRESHGDRIELRFASQPIKGVIDPVERKWFERAAEFVDIIGGLPERDEHNYGRGEEHLETIFDIAEKHDKPLHIHIDQGNSPSQRDTEKALEITRRRGLVGRVSLIHCISLAAQAADYRRAMYERMRELDVSVISCPSAWIDSRRNETLAPTHNASTPVDEMVEEGVNVALGTDNICDIYKPFSDGDMNTELRILLEANHLYNIEQLARIATTNGLKALSINSKSHSFAA